MKLNYTKREIAYLAITFVILLAGAAYAYRTHNASGMSGVGSILIIVGVFFASRDFHELLAARMLKLAPLQREFGFHSEVNEAEDAQKRAFSGDEVRKLRADFDKEFDASLKAATQATKIRHRFVEAFIVILGTAVNGFGPSFLQHLMK